MRSLIIFLLISVSFDAAFARNLVKRSCCCDNYNECSSSCSTPCNRPRNCDSNNNNNWSPCNNNPVEKEPDAVPVLIPFPPTSNATFPEPPVETNTNNTNINNNIVDVNIQNTIDNVNNISVPISLNSTNENTVIVHFEKLPAGNPADESQPTVAPSTVDCCLVVTLGKCDENGENCEQSKEWICSEVCKGSTVIDDSDPEVPPQLKIKNENSTNPMQETTAPLCKLADGTSIACPSQSTVSEPQPAAAPCRLTVKYAKAPIPVQVTPIPLCKLANGTSIACPIQAPVHSVPYQGIYQPTPQPRYYFPWLPIPRNYTTRPLQQVPRVPSRPIYTQPGPFYTLPSTPVVATQPVYQQPFQTIQQVPRYVVVPQFVPQFVPRMDQRQYLGAYQANVGTGFWGAYQRTYQAPCSSQGTWQAPCGTPVGQY